jgi:hypothetical protein
MAGQGTAGTARLGKVRPGMARQARHGMAWQGAARQGRQGQQQETAMAYEQKDNSGSLFRNDKRETDSQPHAKGSALIEGVEFWVSA